MADSLAIVLAAGKGSRMESDLPKVLMPVCGRPMIDYVLDVLEKLQFDRVIAVVGHKSELVRQTLVRRKNVEFVEQTEQLGTGHAVQECSAQLTAHAGPVLVLTGDSPLTQESSLRKIMQLYREEHPHCILGTLIKDDPAGLGRIVRDSHGQFLGIVEQKDATAQQRQIKEVNMSTYLFESRELSKALGQLKNDNNQKEYYLTDCPGILKSAGKDIRALPVLQPCEALSVNNLTDLQAVEVELRKHLCEN